MTYLLCTLHDNAQCFKQVSIVYLPQMFRSMCKLSQLILLNSQSRRHRKEISLVKNPICREIEADKLGWAMLKKAARQRRKTQFIDKICGCCCPFFRSPSQIFAFVERVRLEYRLKLKMNSKRERESAQNAYKRRRHAFIENSSKRRLQSVKSKQYHESVSARSRIFEHFQLNHFNYYSFRAFELFFFCSRWFNFVR